MLILKNLDLWILFGFVPPRESSNNHRDSHHYNSHRGHYGGQHNGNNSAADRGAGPERRGLAGGKQSFASQSSSISSNNTTNNNVSNNQHHQTALPGILTFSWTSHIRPFLQLHSTGTHSSVSVSSYLIWQVDTEIERDETLHPMPHREAAVLCPRF